MPRRGRCGINTHIINTIPSTCHTARRSSRPCILTSAQVCPYLLSRLRVPLTELWRQLYRETMLRQVGVQSTLSSFEIAHTSFLGINYPSSYDNSHAGNSQCNATFGLCSLEFF